MGANHLHQNSSTKFHTEFLPTHHSSHQIRPSNLFAFGLIFLLICLNFVALATSNKMDNKVEKTSAEQQQEVEQHEKQQKTTTTAAANVEKEIQTCTVRVQVPNSKLNDPPTRNMEKSGHQLQIGFHSYSAGYAFNIPTKWQIKKNWFTGSMTIRDEWENEVFLAKNKPFYFLRGVHFIDNRVGAEVGHIKQKFHCGMSKFDIIIGGKKYAKVKKELGCCENDFSIKCCKW